MAPPIKPAL